MEKQIVTAFKKWCRQNLGPGEKPTATHAVLFFLDLGANGAEDWKTVHRVLSRAGVIE